MNEPTTKGMSPEQADTMIKSLGFIHFGGISNDTRRHILMLIRKAYDLGVAAQESPWTTIAADAGTLPPDNGRYVLLTIHIEGVNEFDEEYSEEQVIKARYYYNVDDSAGWYDGYLDPVEIDLPDQIVKAVAWQPWPAPYGG